MIATVQNTKRRVTVNGNVMTVWEGLTQGGVRFHLFVIAARPMNPNDPKLSTFQVEIGVAKTPAVDTNLLPASFDVTA